ncbi:MAG TPA: DNA-binding protein, partial [Bacillota bacterium]|nr:DNA-binding protein [Bacillota bacterium]
NDAGIANELDEARCDTFDTLSLYYLESRYGESWGELLKKCTEPAVKDLLEKTRGIFLWLKTRLR